MQSNISFSESTTANQILLKGVQKLNNAIVASLQISNAKKSTGLTRKLENLVATCKYRSWGFPRRKSPPSCMLEGLVKSPRPSSKLEGLVKSPFLQ